MVSGKSCICYNEELLTNWFIQGFLLSAHMPVKNFGKRKYLNILNADAITIVLLFPHLQTILFRF